LPGKLNERADIISRRRVERSETSLNPDLLPDLEALHGPITCDLFAGRHNRLAERFFSPTPDFAAVATDAFNQNWAAETNPLANPPFALLPRVLRQVEEQQAVITLIAPVWGATW
jgi:hypothetical protein